MQTEYSYLVDRLWLSRNDPETKVWESEQVGQPRLEKADLMDTPEGKGMGLLDTYSRRDLLSIATYLYAKDVKWPASENKPLVIKIANATNAFTGSEERKALYFAVQAAELSDDSEADYVEMLPDDFTDQAGNQWSLRPRSQRPQARTFSLRAGLGFTILQKTIPSRA